ncbi:TadE/TadG family type IV pilus assembly protein [Paraburkholderia hospita]|uniref:TadE/TadG family type IV pilus assembly protein n=1 Tax=Paraburkholderia hospita TaxID=169430 RepID=UPI000271C722|nr:TadE/TadG family type IV pilus assembly protein [Paraburkholderia hospita]EUC14344.1 TadE family protein [Burkholderia sp. BT03]SKC93610.1 Flp pilus assembly protein TadG [Paraburkholderia hospita]
MNRLNIHRLPGARRQRGVAAVEFALILMLVFLPLLIGIMEMGRVLFYWNTAGEATRMGARVAVVCDINSSQNANNPVIRNMQQLLPILQPSNVTIEYTKDTPGSCDATSCTAVTVSIANVAVNTVVPFVPFNLTMPPFSTRLPRESLNSVGGTNPTCS